MLGFACTNAYGYYCLQRWCTSSHAAAAQGADPRTHMFPVLELVLTFSNHSNAPLMPRDLPFLGRVYSVVGLDQGW